MQDAKVRYALLAVCLVCLLGSGWVLLTGHRPAPPPVTITPPPAEGKGGDTEAKPTTSAPAPEPARARAQIASAASPRPTRIYVDVAGEVRRPSLYVLPADGRVMQALVAAGGPTSEADLDAVNLAQKVTDGEKIFVPRRGVSPPAPSPAPSSAPARAVPDTLPFSSTSDAASPAARTARTGKGGHSGHADKISPDGGEQIALNSATLEELERLPGVGPSMAGRILAYRQQAGSFTKVEDLRLVQGIGPKKFARIAPCVKLD